MIPTAFDKTLCPEGTHIMSLFTQWVPADWSEEPHTEELEAYADRMIDCYNEVAPNFKSSILHRDIVGPYEMEHEYGLIGGNIFHGELSLEQLFHMRPAPATPTTAPRSAACTTAARPRTRAAGSAASPAGRRPGPRIADKKAARRAGQVRQDHPAVMISHPNPERSDAATLGTPPGPRAGGSADGAALPGSPTAAPGPLAAEPRLHNAASGPHPADAARTPRRRPPLAAMLEARSIALVGASAPAGPRSASGWSRRWPGARPGRTSTWSTPGIPSSAGGRACPRWPSCPAPWTWSCWPCPTPPWSSSSRSPPPAATGRP